MIYGKQETRQHSTLDYHVPSRGVHSDLSAILGLVRYLLQQQYPFLPHHTNLTNLRWKV